MVYPQDRILFVKKGKSATIWMDLETIIVNEKSHTQEGKYCYHIV
jgi:hypothetical protein